MACLQDPLLRSSCLDWSAMGKHVPFLPLRHMRAQELGTQAEVEPNLKLEILDSKVESEGEAGRGGSRNLKSQLHHLAYPRLLSCELRRRRPCLWTGTDVSDDDDDESMVPRQTWTSVEI